VPQYTVRARLEKPEGVSLRDGLLADITIVQEKKEGVLRIPSSAVSYVQGTPQVTLLTGLSEKDRTSVLASGIVDTKTLHYTTETRPVSLGLKGAYFVEVSSGLSESDLVVVTKTTTSSATTNTQEASVVRTQRTGGGGVPPRN
jgi:hypothetical protein